MSMARPDENDGFKSSYSPIIENEQEGQENDDAVSAATWCGCFRFPCFVSGRRSNQEFRYLLHQNQRAERKESWVVEKLKELKELSEVVAGPKWKNFVRKVGKHCNLKKSRPTATATATAMKSWTYSPNSYAMNFDEGPDFEEEDKFFRSFSSRFSAPFSCDQNKDDRRVHNNSPAELVVQPR